MTNTSQQRLAVGDVAPEFTLTAGNSIRVSLRDVLATGRRAVVAFYVFDFSGDCTNEWAQLESMMEDFEESHARVLGISVDSRHAHAAYARILGISAPLLSDFNKEVAEAYGVLTDLGELRGVARRSVFVVNPDGKLSYVWEAEKPSDLPNFQEVLAAVR
ncbi:MAG: redoxin domain-containing protein [Chloroflexia bacterium]